MPHILVLDDIAQEGIDILKSAEGITYEVKPKLKGAELNAFLKTGDAAILRSGVTITAEALKGNTRLKALARAGVGTDNIDKETATRMGIVVMNTPGGNTVSTAEHAFALMLGLSRNIAPAYQSLIEGRWDRKLYQGTQIAEKTVGVVGLGRIGLEFAARAKAFQMHVLGYDPLISKERCEELGIELVGSMEEMLPRVDYLSVHTPKTPETEGMIGTKELEIIKPGCRLINAARGGIFDNGALVDGLKSGKLGGVALDVYPEEPCTDNPLFGMTNVLCTPHLGASTDEAQVQVAVEGVHLLINYLTTGEIRHAVNVAALDPQTLSALRGYINLTYRLGLLQAQWHGGRAKRCNIIYRGDLAAKDTKILTSAFCAGLIERAMEEEVNIINAPVLLKERGIEMSEKSVSEHGVFSSSVLVEVETDDGSFLAGGALFGADMPRLIRLGEFRMEAYLDGALLIFSHRDVPGIIGTVGTIFGKYNVNIGQMSVGRAGSSPGGEAIGVLNLDTAPDEAAIEEIMAHPDIVTAKVIELPAAGATPVWLR